MSDLSKKQCAPCRGGVPPLKGPELDALFAQLDGGWSVVDEHHLEKEYRFDDFRQALDFTNRVGEMAEDQDHHPRHLPGLGPGQLAVERLERTQRLGVRRAVGGALEALAP